MQENHLSPPTEGSSSSPHKTIELSPFRCRRDPTQLFFQIVHDLIFLTFSTCLVHLSSTRQETEESHRVTPVSTELTRNTNSNLPRHGMIRCPTKSTRNSVPLARTQATITAACDLTCTDHCQTIAASNQPGIDPHVLERCFFRGEQEIHLRLPAFLFPPNFGHAIPVSPRVVRTKPKTQQSSWSTLALSESAHDLPFVKGTVASPTNRPSSKPFRLMPGKSGLDTVKATRDLLERFPVGHNALSRMRQMHADDQRSARQQSDSHPTYTRCVNLRVSSHVGPC